MKWSVLAVAAIFAGCVQSNETYTASGQRGHVISCTPALSTGIVGAIANSSTSWGTCYQKAGEICGAKGYNVLTKSDEPTFSELEVLTSIGLQDRRDTAPPLAIIA